MHGYYSVPQSATDVPRSPSVPEPSMKPKVLIVGAGIGGLFLGNLLQLAGVRYEIFERAPEVKPLGQFVEREKGAQLFQDKHRDQRH